jgi:hypothetical protein
VSEINENDPKLIDHIDFTYLRNCLVMNNYDDQKTFEKIKENLVNFKPTLLRNFGSECSRSLIYPIWDT